MTDIRTNIKNDSLRTRLAEVFSDKRNWNRNVEIDGYTFNYNAATNMGYVIVLWNGTHKGLATFCWAFGKFMWTC